MSAEKAVVNKAVAELSLDWRHQDELEIDQAALKHSIHLWTLDLDDLDLESLVARATEAEVNRASRILNSHKRLLYLGGRAGLRTLLSRYTGISVDELQIGYGDRGKPRLLHSPFEGELTFNYTLSGDKVLYALSIDRQLGVDMEKLPREINSARMARNKLTVTEQVVWSSLEKVEKDCAMLSCWTRKEAYGKVVGVGIRYFLNQVALFTNLQNPWFQTSRAGIFETTSQSAMPDLLQGVQIALPFNGVATLMYERHTISESELPLLAARLEI